MDKSCDDDEDDGWERDDGEDVVEARRTLHSNNQQAWKIVRMVGIVEMVVVVVVVVMMFVLVGVVLVLPRQIRGIYFLGISINVINIFDKPCLSAANGSQNQDAD